MAFFKAASTFAIVSFASPNNSDVFAAYSSSFSTPANPGRIDRLQNTTCCARSTSRLGMPESFFDDKTVRRAAMMHGIPCVTTLTGSAASVSAIRALRDAELDVRSLQEYHADVVTGAV